MQQKQCTIDGINYQFSHYSGTKATTLFAKIVKFLGGGLSASSIFEKEVNATTLGILFVQAMASAVNPVEFTEMAKEIVNGSHIDDKGNFRPINYDLDFQGKIGHLFKFIKEMLFFQYNDFLSVVAEATKTTQATATSEDNKAIRTKAL